MPHGGPLLIHLFLSSSSRVDDSHLRAEGIFSLLYDSVCVCVWTHAYFTNIKSAGIDYSNWLTRFHKSILVFPLNADWCDKGGFHVAIKFDVLIQVWISFMKHAEWFQKNVMTSYQVADVLLFGVSCLKGGCNTSTSDGSPLLSDISTVV